MFLAAIVVASKFLQDRTYSNRTWAKISGLSPREIEQLERIFLRTIQYNLYVNEAQWTAWTRELTLQRLHIKLPCMPQESGEVSDQVATKSSAIPSRLHRATSENVLGQAYPFDASLREPQLPARSRQRWARHGTSL
ncbi:PHO85 cyclin-5 [Malassezia nana]|uniref:PHO85 cyclin-5 n=1 Tax=Malassezia nana TaxID=180528 RepID=A0AAF0J282_9BASI|nr:PHO85 cyclin-5 [Malassezia nana]